MYKVIVVDDEALIREAICKKVNWGAIGYELVGAFENGKKAMEYLSQHEVDVVLTDICMPYMDGIELSEYIYLNQPAVKVIIFSGFDEFEYAKKAIRYQVHEYLLKPVTALELTEILLKLKNRMDQDLEKKKKNARISKVVHKNKIYLQSTALYKVVSGSENQEEALQELRENEIDVKGSQFAVAIIKTGIRNNAKEENPAQSSLMQFIIFNMVEEIVRQHNLGWTGISQQGGIFILFATDKQIQKEFLTDIKKCIAKIRETLLEKTNEKFLITVGNSVFSMEHIPDSYSRSMEYGKYSYLYENGKVLYAGEINRKEWMKTDETTFVEHACAQICRGDIAGVEQQFETLKKQMQEAYLEKGRVCVYLQVCLKSIFEYFMPLINGQWKMEQTNQIMCRIENASSIDQAFKEIMDACRELSTQYQKNNCGEHTRIVIMAMDYIHKNYGNVNLNLTFLCNYFGISISRFSAAFKAYYNETFMEALIRVRMEQAKQLIQNSDMKNYEIAERVGFADPHYFSVSFKKITGKTPTEWGRGHEDKKVGTLC